MYRKESKYFETEYGNDQVVRINVFDEYHSRPSWWRLAIYNSPTSNCQVCTFANISELMLYIRPIKLAPIIKQIVRYYQETCNKRIILMDVNQDLTKSIISAFKPFTERIVLQSKYDSTNGSKMEILMIALIPKHLLNIRKY